MALRSDAAAASDMLQMPHDLDRAPTVHTEGSNCTEEEQKNPATEWSKFNTTGMKYFSFLSKEAEKVDLRRGTVEALKIIRSKIYPSKVV